MISRTRRSAQLLLGTGAVMAVAACSTTPPLTIGEAVYHYDKAAESVLAALPDGTTDWAHSEGTRKLQADGDSCAYTPGDWVPSAPLHDTDDSTWQARIDALNPVLEEHGFDPVDDVVQQGSRQLLETEDDHDATLTLTAEGELRIWGAEVDADPCDPAELGIE